MALALALFVARQPVSLWVPPPDVEHVAPTSHGHAGHNATRHRVSSRAAQSPLVKRLPALPALAWTTRSERGFVLASRDASLEHPNVALPFRIQRHIPRMDSDEPPRG